MQYCIHGHFYQPPREDPISNYIPDEIGAEPFNNWNERILSECYEPNARTGSFSRISFNVGPTLLRWMEAAHPDVYQSIIDQDRQNYERYGVGNAMAQGYNHIILPLATKRDKVTQIYWGIRDFEHRFGHLPGGIWLPETAVDIETLCVASDLGLRFTIVAPWQVRLAEGDWGPMTIQLPDGREPFVVFPYDQEFSTRISFVPQSTSNGDDFLNHLKHVEYGNPNTLRLIASDGELYGHHQPFRDYFLDHITGQGAFNHGIHWTWPERWLLENQPVVRAELNEFTSWSCLHGVERWRGQCACTPYSDWKQPLRYALDQLAGWLDEIFVREVEVLVGDPWDLRNKYIDVINGRSSVGELVASMAGRTVEPQKVEQVSLLLRAQYERQRMYTSCGFFFDEFHRIEPQNSLAYAANASWLTEKATGQKTSRDLMELLKNVQSNRTGLKANTVLCQTLFRAETEAS